MDYKTVVQQIVRVTSLTTLPFWRRYTFFNKKKNKNNDNSIKQITPEKNKPMKLITTILVVTFALASCTGSDQAKRNNQNEKTMARDSTQQYGYNRDFLKKQTDAIELNNLNSAITLVPEWQGRVMTSTAEGDTGYSFGWINRKLIASGKILPHINAYGGEERLWLGPEGGQFSIFFSKGKSFIYEDWQTPAYLDTSPWELISNTDTSAFFASDIITENFSGTLFKLRIERKVTLLSDKEITKQTGINSENLNCVAYRSGNTIINKGETEWKKETGLLSIWMLGMFNPSPSVIIVIPVKPGDEKLSGPKVNDNYFGKISEDRLKVSGNHIYFRADGKSRGKIGIPPLRATGTMGSYDSDNNVLTLLICKLPAGETDYVNSSWQIQENPYSGDALNSYNDGPLEDGTQMGPFYELETSSPAANLKPGESLSHNQITIHLTGNINLLDKVSRKILGVSLEDIRSAI
ncbi:MAG TPA: DUF6786 family protein [Bacteroidales bacterium]|nr:DUF6786 family protein [Bacteroidales bacterium]